MTLVVSLFFRVLRRGPLRGAGTPITLRSMRGKQRASCGYGVVLG